MRSSWRDSVHIRKHHSKKTAPHGEAARLPHHEGLFYEIMQSAACARDHFILNAFRKSAEQRTVSANAHDQIRMRPLVFAFFAHGLGVRDVRFSNLYKSNIDFRNFVSRKLTEVK